MSAITLAVGLGGIFVAIVILLGTIGVITAERAQIGRSLSAVRAIELAPESMRRDLDRPFAERVAYPGMQRLIRIGRRLTPEGGTEKIRQRLDLAGNPEGWDVDRVIAFKVLAAILGAILGLGFPLVLGASALVVIGVGIGLTVVGWFAPNLTLYQIAYNRTERMRKELPDALDLLSITVEAGLAFDSALAHVAKNTTGPLAEEFFRVLQEMQIGRGRMDALRALGERTSLPELRGFVTAMVQADSFGIPIANVLRVQAKELRIKRSQLAEEKAQKVPVKILFPLIFCIMPSLFIVILGPAAITIYHNILGHH